jgi:methylmalonyl-CoA/ethylmalonyl-CoA epimerase
MIPKRFFGSVPFNLGVLNHVAIATKNLDSASRFYKNVLQAKVSEPLPLPEHGVTTVFVNFGNTKIELLEPLGEKSPIKNFLEKNGEGIHHICIEVDDLSKSVDWVQSKGVKVLDKPKIGAHGKPVVFLHPKSCGGVLVELEAK